MALLLAGGCGYFDATAPDGGGTTSASGFGQPTIEVTVGGVHAGPGAPDATSTASLDDAYDVTTGQLAQSTFQLTAMSTALGAGCSISLQRYGAEQPLGAGTWQFSDASATDTADGQAAPLGSPTASIPGSAWSCSGDQCNGGAITISAIDALHVEGYFSGTFTGASGDADVVCSFYLPMGTYNP